MRTKYHARPFSLAARLTFFISLAVICAFIIFTWVMINSAEKHFAEQDINDLKQISSTLENILSNQDEQENVRLARLYNVLINYSNIFVYLQNDKNKVLYQTPDKPEMAQLVAAQRDINQADSSGNFIWTAPISTSAINNNQEMKHAVYRVVQFPVTTQVTGQPVTYHLLIALSIDFHLHYIDDLKNKLIMTASIIGIVIVFIVLFAVYQGHAPLRRVSYKIKNITSENLDVRLEPTGVPIELEQLVISFNHMIERIENVFTRQSNFSADIAHEMRTPITNLVTQTEIALSQPRTQKELEDVLYSNLEELTHMTKMVSDMLFLAQADNNQLVPEWTLIDLKSEVIKVIEFFEAWAEEREVSLKLSGDTLLVKGDALMLRRAISNLLSNAIRYTPCGQTITVHVNEVGEHVQLIIENPGTPIPKEHLPRLFDRFYRVDPSRQRKSEGSGIGLAIVKSIVTAHQGKISVTSDVVSTKFILSLPKTTY